MTETVKAKIVRLDRLASGDAFQLLDRADVYYAITTGQSNEGESWYIDAWFDAHCLKSETPVKVIGAGRIAHRWTESAVQP